TSTGRFGTSMSAHRILGREKVPGLWLFGIGSGARAGFSTSCDSQDPICCGRGSVAEGCAAYERAGGDAPLVHLLSGHGQGRVAMCGSNKPLKASKREGRSKICIPNRAFWKTTSSIGGRYKGGNPLSRAVLIRPPA